MRDTTATGLSAIAADVKKLSQTGGTVFRALDPTILFVGLDAELKAQLG
jgi:hypothetical protein